jgi:hypothetical protein
MTKHTTTYRESTVSYGYHSILFVDTTRHLESNHITAQLINTAKCTYMQAPEGEIGSFERLELRIAIARKYSSQER